MDSEEPAAAHGIVDRAHGAEAQLLDVVEGRFVGVAAGPGKKNLLQLGAAAARDVELARRDNVSQDA